MGILLLCFLAGCSQQVKHAMPQDLLYEGKPLHPRCVVATQFGGSERYEPQQVAYVKDSDCVSEDIAYDAHTNTVTSTLDYCITCAYDQKKCTQEYTIADSYQYIGSCRGKHVVCGDTYDTSGTGRFGFLGLVQREGDCIKNAGTLACGDRGEGGLIKVVSLNHNLLRYSQCATYDMFAEVCVGDGAQNDFPFPYRSCGISIIYEVDLSCCDKKQFHTKVVGFVFDPSAYQHKYTYSDERVMQFVHCFDTLADTYIKEGKKELTLAQGQSFFDAVLKTCM